MPIWYAIDVFVVKFGESGVANSTLHLGDLLKKYAKQTLNMGKEKNLMAKRSAFFASKFPHEIQHKIAECEELTIRQKSSIFELNNATVESSRPTDQQLGYDYFACGAKLRG